MGRHECAFSRLLEIKPKQPEKRCLRHWSLTNKHAVDIVETDQWIWGCTNRPTYMWRIDFFFDNDAKNIYRGQKVSFNKWWWDNWITT